MKQRDQNHRTSAQGRGDRTETRRKNTDVQISPETKYPPSKSRAGGGYLLQFRSFTHHPTAWTPKAGASADTSEPGVLQSESWKSRYTPLELCGSGGKSWRNKPTLTVWQLNSCYKKTNFQIYFCNFFKQRKQHTPWGKVRGWEDRPWVKMITTAPGAERPAEESGPGAAATPEARCRLRLGRPVHAPCRAAIDPSHKNLPAHRETSPTRLQSLSGRRPHLQPRA